MARGRQSKKLSAVSLSRAVPLQLYLALRNCCGVCSGALCLWDLGYPPYLKKPEDVEPELQLINFVVQVPCWYSGVKKTSETQLQDMYAQLNPIWAVLAARNKLEIQTDGNPSKNVCYFIFQKDFVKLFKSMHPTTISVSGLWGATQTELMRGLCFSMGNAELPFCISNGNSSSR